MSLQSEAMSVDTPEHIHESRTNWMSTAGRQLYSDYYSFVTDRTRIDPVLDVVNVGSAIWTLPKVAEVVTARLVSTEAKYAKKSPLIGHEDEILHFTAASDFYDEGVTKFQAVARHNRDSMVFAHVAAAATAQEILNTNGFNCMYVTDRKQVITAGAALYRNPTFGKIMDVVATTGFGVIGMENIPVGKYTDGLTILKKRLELEADEPVITAAHVVDSIDRFSDVELRPTPLFKAALARELRAQNRMVAGHTPADLDDKAPPLLVRHAGRQAFSRGCPVANSPTFDALRLYQADTLDATLQMLKGKVGRWTMRRLVKESERLEQANRREPANTY